MDWSGLKTIKKAIVAFALLFVSTVAATAQAGSVDLQNGVVTGLTSLVGAVLVWWVKNAEKVTDSVKDEIEKL